MRIKLGLSHWGENIGWGCPRTGCWVSTREHNERFHDLDSSSQYYCGSQNNAIRHITHVVGFAGGGTWRIRTRGRARNRREDIIKMDLKILRLEGVYQERHKCQAFVETVRTFRIHKMRGTLDNTPSNFTGHGGNIHQGHFAAVS